MLSLKLLYGVRACFYSTQFLQVRYFGDGLLQQVILVEKEIILRCNESQLGHLFMFALFSAHGHLG
jgi:hypothetical protein